MNGKRTGALAALLGLAGAGTWLASTDLATHPLIVAWFGPSQVELREVHDREGTATVDHSAFDRVLAAHVDGIRFDYEGLAADRGDFDAYLDVLAGVPLDSLGRDELLALYINAYNAFTLALILDHQPLTSIRDIPEADRWLAERWALGGQTLSLDHIENGVLRAQFIEPRIHFAINCASISCPPLRAEAYHAARLESQLADQARLVHQDGPWLDVRQDHVALSPIFLWYRGDFEQVAGGLDRWIRRYREIPPDISFEWKPYDWNLNRPE